MSRGETFRQKMCRLLRPHFYKGVTQHPEFQLAVSLIVKPHEPLKLRRLHLVSRWVTRILYKIYLYILTFRNTETMRSEIIFLKCNVVWICSRRKYLQDTQCKYKHNIETRSCNHRCRCKAVLHTPSVCVCTLRYPARKAPWLNHIFPHLCHKQHDFRVEVTEYRMCVMIYSTIFV